MTASCECSVLQQNCPFLSFQKNPSYPKWHPPSLVRAPVISGLQISQHLEGICHTALSVWIVLGHDCSSVCESWLWEAAHASMWCFSLYTILIIIFIIGVIIIIIIIIVILCYSLELFVCWLRLRLFAGHLYYSYCCVTMKSFLPKVKVILFLCVYNLISIWVLFCFSPRSQTNHAVSVCCSERTPHFYSFTFYGSNLYKLKSSYFSIHAEYSSIMTNMLRRY